MAPLPWMRAAGTARGDGLLRCLRAMLHPDTPDAEDRWGRPVGLTAPRVVASS